MKIAYIDLNHHDHYESYSINPKKYGGGRVFASWAKEKINNFHIFSVEKSFEDVTSDEKINHCHVITQDQINRIKAGEEILTVIPECKDIDIFVHHFSNIFINTDKAQIVWAVGYGEPINPNIKHLMLYSKNRQNCYILNKNCNIYDVSIGVDFPDTFIEYTKEDFIFQCTRHVEEFGSIEVAKFCNMHNIKCIFAGPIGSNYPLLNFINNKNTYYIGQISEQDKISYTKKAKFCTFIHNWNTPFNLSAIHSLGYGTPIIARPIGFWPDLIQHTNNGFLVNSYDDIYNAWQNRNNVHQLNCFNSVKNKYDINSMINSFESAIKLAYNTHNQ
jgi:glycosyltransferase involved in cell wall biosynthesis